MAYTYTVRPKKHLPDAWYGVRINGQLADKDISQRKDAVQWHGGKDWGVVIATLVPDVRHKSRVRVP
jgi:hypothetical protein